MLQADIIEEFKRVGIARSYRADETIFLHQEPSTGMYLILHGDAKIVRRTPTGATEEITSIGPGETMGEVSLLLNKPHSATVIAKTDVELLLLTRSTLENLKRNNPPAALRLFEILAFTLARHLYERPW